MYVGFFPILCGWAILLRNALVFPLLPVFVLYMNHFQIRSEERALTETFGALFTGYTARATVDLGQAQNKKTQAERGARQSKRKVAADQHGQSSSLLSPPRIGTLPSRDRAVVHTRGTSRSVRSSVIIRQPGWREQRNASNAPSSTEFDNA